MGFSFRNLGVEPDKPEGAFLWRFQRIGSDEIQTVPADSPDDAWEGIRFYKDDDWYQWKLLGRDDLVEAGYTHIEVASSYYLRHPTTVERWEENDEE